jgi:hypothetical protein
MIDVLPLRYMSSTEHSVADSPNTNAAVVLQRPPRVFRSLQLYFDLFLPDFCPQGKIWKKEIDT